MPASLSLRIKEQYMAKRARGLSQQIAADAVGISVRSAQRIDRGELQAQGSQQRSRQWRTRADPLAEVWENVVVPADLVESPDPQERSADPLAPA